MRLFYNALLYINTVYKICLHEANKFNKTVTYYSNYPR